MVGHKEFTYDILPLRGFMPFPVWLLKYPVDLKNGVRFGVIYHFHILA